MGKRGMRREKSVYPKTDGVRGITRVISLLKEDRGRKKL